MTVFNESSALLSEMSHLGADVRRMDLVAMRADLSHMQQPARALRRDVQQLVNDVQPMYNDGIALVLGASHAYADARAMDFHAFHEDARNVGHQVEQLQHDLSGTDVISLSL